MKVYVAVVEDRHTDPDPQVFTTAEAAIAYARQDAQDNTRPPDAYEEQEIEGKLFFASYTLEDDCNWVVERELRS